MPQYLENKEWVWSHLSHSFHHIWEKHLKVKWIWIVLDKSPSLWFISTVYLCLLLIWLLTMFSIIFWHYLLSFTITLIFPLKNSLQAFNNNLYEGSFKRHSCATEIAYTQPNTAKKKKVTYRVVYHESVCARKKLYWYEKTRGYLKSWFSN